MDLGLLERRVSRRDPLPDFKAAPDSVATADAKGRGIKDCASVAVPQRTTCPPNRDQYRSTNLGSPDSEANRRSLVCRSVLYPHAKPIRMTRISRKRYNIDGAMPRRARARPAESPCCRLGRIVMRPSINPFAIAGTRTIPAKKHG